jgi:hypothetical protein
LSGATNNVIVAVKNTSGATLVKGTAVYITGASGQRPTVSKALATSDATSAQTLGLVSANIANNSNGNVTIIGLIKDFDTSAYTDGQQLYLSPTTAGALTATKPVAPNHMVYIAVVEHSDATTGRLFVKVQNGYELDELHDVAIASKANNDSIYYNSTTGLWENKTPANERTALGLATVATTGSYNDLSDKPTAVGQVNSDWNSSSGLSQILNKPTLFSGAYNDLTGKPTLGTAAATNSTDYATAAQGTLATNALPKAGGTMTGAISFAAGQTFPGAGGLTYVYTTTAVTVTDKQGVLADTASSAFTVTLPATPSVGAQVVVADAGSNWGTNNLTVGRNGSTIGGLAENLVCDISGVSVQLVYDGTTWEVYAQVGGQGGSAVTLSGTQTLTNKTISGSSNTLTNVSLTSAVTGTLPSANGGTGLASPGSNGNVLTSNGTTWTSAAPSAALPAAGAVGAYALAFYFGAPDISFGGSVAGSSLRYSAGSSGIGNWAVNNSNLSPSGTWRNMGGVGPAAAVQQSTYGLFLRIA